MRMGDKHDCTRGESDPVTRREVNEMWKKIDAIDVVLNGNGKPGLVTWVWVIRHTYMWLVGTLSAAAGIIATLIVQHFSR
jgi:hypothetical protein